MQSMLLVLCKTSEQVTCSKCFSPSSSSVSCDMAVSLLIGANMLEGNGNVFATALGTSMCFCCGSCTEDAVVATADSAAREKERKIKSNVKQRGISLWLKARGLNFHCKLPPVRAVEMWFMGKDSSMQLDLGTCRGTLAASGGGST